MRVAIVAILLAGSAHAAPALPAHYAKLFDPTASWTYSVKRGAETLTVTCKVARIAKFDAVLASEVTCDREIGADFPVPGAYFSRTDGVYRSGLGFPATRDDIGDFSVHQLVMAAKPKAGTSTTVDRYSAQAQKSTTTFSVEKSGTAWCWVRTTKRGVTKTDTLCFDGGITSGNEGDLAFVTKPRPTPKPATKP